MADGKVFTGALSNGHKSRSPFSIGQPVEAAVTSVLPTRSETGDRLPGSQRIKCPRIIVKLRRFVRAQGTDCEAVGAKSDKLTNDLPIFDTVELFAVSDQAEFNGHSVFTLPQGVRSGKAVRKLVVYCPKGSHAKGSDRDLTHAAACSENRPSDWRKYDGFEKAQESGSIIAYRARCLILLPWRASSTFDLAREFGTRGLETSSEGSVKVQFRTLTYSGLVGSDQKSKIRRKDIQKLGSKPLFGRSSAGEGGAHRAHGGNIWPLRREVKGADMEWGSICAATCQACMPISAIGCRGQVSTVVASVGLRADTYPQLPVNERTELIVEGHDDNGICPGRSKAPGEDNASTLKGSWNLNAAFNAPRWAFGSALRTAVRVLAKLQSAKSHTRRVEMRSIRVSSCWKGKKHVCHVRGEGYGGRLVGFRAQWPPAQQPSPQDAGGARELSWGTLQTRRVMRREGTVSVPRLIKRRFYPSWHPARCLAAQTCSSTKRAPPSGHRQQSVEPGVSCACVLKCCSLPPSKQRPSLAHVERPAPSRPPPNDGKAPEPPVVGWSLRTGVAWDSSFTAARPPPFRDWGGL
ncbi:uncharacterized protein BDR25DRAFT_371294 [Lindgomyces ingoldianus]|uniref:Uncharacterized protein n=1 Tax=Lindgomyces ingoldianus TaxID=673940 RepID=A0ACB6RDD0_9PLEO|nr:uncharacterized protein BDR25DRAFT_371294 [Lindgomyces ingoldianus]KAF2477254.1 hypothetical protein BDR25DRAFT_371294 [Lindgomyces ingoldianus]